MLQYSIFIYIPSALCSSRVPERLRPNAFRPLPKTDRLELEYSCHGHFLYPILHRSELQIHQRWRTLRCKRCICTSTRFLRVRILPSVPVPLAPNIYNPNLSFGFGVAVGAAVGFDVGAAVGLAVGAVVGFVAGLVVAVGLEVGFAVGAAVGLVVDAVVGFRCGRRLRSRAAAGRRFAHSIVARAGLRCRRRFLRLHSASILCCR